MVAKKAKPKADLAPKLSSKSIESRALYFGGTVFLLGTVIGLLAFWGELVPLFGRPSIGGLASILAAVSGFAGFIVAYKPPPRKISNTYQRVRGWLTVAALAFIHASICFLLSVAGFFIVQNAFEGVLLDQWVSSLLVGITTAGAGYIVYLAATKITSASLSTTLAVFLLSGSLTSMITAEDPYWWQYHFSSLGGGGTPSAYAFNVTLIIGGLVIVALSDLVAADFEKLQSADKDKYAQVKVNIIRLVLAAIGVMLAFVGLFVWNVYPTIHNLSAGGMALLFIALMAFLPKIAPSFSRAFFLFSYSLMGALIICYWLYINVGYLNLTAFELLSAGIVFSWMIVFVRQIAAGLDDQSLLVA